MPRPEPSWRTYLFAPLRFGFKVYMVVVFALVSAIFFPFAWFKLRDPKDHEAAFRIKVLWCKAISVAIFTRFRIEGKDNVPAEKPYIICINHQSYLDIIYMFVAVPHYFKFIGKKELRSWPMIGTFFKMGMDISVSRENSIEARRSLEEAMQALDEGVSIGIFPEGKIPLDTPNLHRFKNGAFKMALTKQVPILPVTFVYNDRRLGDPFTFLGAASPGRCEVVIHPAIHTQGMDLMDIAPLRDKVFSVINDPLVERGLSTRLEDRQETASKT